MEAELVIYICRVIFERLCMEAVALFVPEIHVLQKDSKPDKSYDFGGSSKQMAQGLQFPDQYAIVAKIKSQMSALLTGQNQRRITN